MRVLVATTAGSGHFGPMLPFAAACAAAGHEVRVAAPASFAATVARSGLGHVPLADVSADELGAVFGRFPGLSLRETSSLVIREVFGGLDARASLPGLRAAVDEWRPDLVLREPAELGSYVVARERDLPSVDVNIGLDTFTDQLAELLDEPLRDLGCADGASGYGHGPRLTLVPGSFDLAAGRGQQPHRFRDARAVPATAGAPPDSWPARHADRPLVYVSFGSVTAGLGLFPAFYRAVLEALEGVPVRVLMTLGEAGDPAALGNLPDNAHVERWWPQADVMPHTSVVVGHGGFGTTMLALAAGVPQVVVPLFSFDQFANADRVATVRAGVALTLPDARERLAGSLVPAGPDVLDRLAHAVTTLLDDQSFRVTARALRDEVAALPMTAESVALLEQVAATRR